MEEGFARKEVEVSDRFKASNSQVYEYGLDTFGCLQAERYNSKINEHLLKLPIFYYANPECRHLRTKSRMYRNIILDSHLIIYRITNARIEVLDIVHSASSVRKIQLVRRIQV
jgi:plasmid stabilization system protein ParE